MDESKPSPTPGPSAEQIETWRAFRAQRAKSTRDLTDGWRMARRQTADQLVAIQEGWSVGITRGDGKILVVDGPFQGQRVTSRQAADEAYAPGLMCRLKVRAKKATRHSPAMRIALEVHLLAAKSE